MDEKRKKPLDPVERIKRGVKVMNLNELICKSGIKKREIAKALGISPQRLNDVLHGRRELPTKWIEPLCSALHCDPNTIFGWDVYQVPQDSLGIKTYRGGAAGGTDEKGGSG